MFSVVPCADVAGNSQLCHNRACGSDRVSGSDQPTTNSNSESSDCVLDSSRLNSKAACAGESGPGSVGNSDSSDCVLDISRLNSEAACAGEPFLCSVQSQEFIRDAQAVVGSEEMKRAEVKCTGLTTGDAATHQDREDDFCDLDNESCTRVGCEEKKRKDFPRISDLDARMAACDFSKFPNPNEASDKWEFTASAEGAESF